MSNPPAFAGATEAAKMACAALGFLAAADPTELATQEQARCLHALEQVNAMSTAARAVILGAFTAGRGYCEDADYSPRSWLIHRTRITKGAAAAHTAWARRAAAHPRVTVVLAEGQMSESYARTTCEWSDKLPEDCRDAADAILVAAVRAGADLTGLAELAGEIYARSLPGLSDDGPDQSFEDRSLRVETTFAGAGVISGDLTPECAAVVTAVLESLSAPAGADDTRTREQRYHDGLHEAMQRLIASGLLPERAGQPVKAWVHISLAELRAMDEGSALEDQWITAVRAKWAAARAAASVGAGDGAARLDGDAARAVTCDASLTPIVAGDVDIGPLDDLMRLCVQLDQLDHAADRAGTDLQAAPTAPANGSARPASPAREALERAIIGKAVDLLSGPGGLASFLRTQQLGARLAGPSLPLDVGYSDNVPAGIRNAVIQRDQHCRWAGGCHQPASACQVHHVKHKADGGPTSVKHCILLCFFHHQVVIHRWGWTLVLNPDGTTTAWNPDRTKVLHSHGPPELRVLPTGNSPATTVHLKAWPTGGATIMRIVVTEFVSLDGVMEEPRWTFDFDRGQEGDQFKYTELFDAESLLLGRTTYQGFASAWPNMGGDDFGQRMNGIHKYVVSSTLADSEATWGPTTVIRGDVAAEVAALKSQPGGNLLVEGSAQLVHLLAQHGLVDEYRLMVFPIILGQGKRVFPDTMPGPAKLAIVNSGTVGSGVVLLTLHPFVTA